MFELVTGLYRPSTEQENGSLRTRVQGVYTRNFTPDSTTSTVQEWVFLNISFLLAGVAKTQSSLFSGGLVRIQKYGIKSEGYV